MTAKICRRVKLAITVGISAWFCRKIFFLTGRLLDNIRFSNPQATPRTNQGSLPHRQRRRIYRKISRRLSNNCRRTRRKTFRRTATAHRHRPRFAGKSANFNSGRSDFESRFRKRSFDSGRLKSSAAGQNDFRYRAPTFDDSQRRSNSRRRSRRNSRTRNARRIDRK